MLDTVAGRRIGYVTDLRHTPGERRAARTRCSPTSTCSTSKPVFLDADRDHALRKNHLTARQAGEIARAAAARRKVVPFHFSPRYRGDEAALQREVMAYRLEHAA